MPQWLLPLAAAAFAVLLLNIALMVQRVREQSKSWPAQFLTRPHLTIYEHREGPLALLRRLCAFNVAARWKGGSDCSLRVLWSLGMPGA